MLDSHHSLNIVTLHFEHPHTKFIAVRPYVEESNLFSVQPLESFLNSLVTYLDCWLHCRLKVLYLSGIANLCCCNLLSNLLVASWQ